MDTKDLREDTVIAESGRAEGYDDHSREEPFGAVLDSHLLRALAWFMLAISAVSATGILLFNMGLDEDIELLVIGIVYLLLVVSWVSIGFRTHEEAHVASVLSALALSALFAYLFVQWLTPLPPDLTAKAHDPFAKASSSPGRIRGSLRMLASVTTMPLTIASGIMTLRAYRLHRMNKPKSASD